VAHVTRLHHIGDPPTVSSTGTVGSSREGR
jgi:hypothetical protein